MNSFLRGRKRRQSIALNLEGSFVSAVFSLPTDPLSRVLAVYGCRASTTAVVWRAGGLRLCVLQALDFCVTHIHTPKKLGHCTQGISPEPFLTEVNIWHEICWRTEDNSLICQPVQSSCLVDIFQPCQIFCKLLSHATVLDFADTTVVASVWVKGPHYASLLSHCKSGTAAHAEILRRDSVPCFGDTVDTKAKNCLWAVMEVS